MELGLAAVSGWAAAGSGLALLALCAKKRRSPLPHLTPSVRKQPTLAHSLSPYQRVVIQKSGRLPTPRRSPTSAAKTDGKRRPGEEGTTQGTTDGESGSSGSDEDAGPRKRKPGKRDTTSPSTSNRITLGSRGKPYGDYAVPSRFQGFRPAKAEQLKLGDLGKPYGNYPAPRQPPPPGQPN